MFLKFPHTPHLAWLSPGQSRGDKILAPAEAAQFLNGEVVVEEKVDGANVGLSVLDDVIVVQNRGEWIRRPAHSQFSPLWPWLAGREGALREALGNALVLFGEWCYAVHSVRYDSLPDWFLGFDVYDRRDRRFWSAERRNELLQRIGLFSVPELGRGHHCIQDLKLLLSEESSRFGGPIEGLYLRQENDGWLDHRAKLVRAEFAQTIGGHWSDRPIQRNHLRAHSNLR
jgi:RNA ligase